MTEGNPLPAARLRAAASEFATGRTGARDESRGAGPLRLAAFAAALTLALPAAALDPSRNPADYIRTSWRNELPSQNVMAIAQTPDGYLWLGTYDGLVRFDGVNFDLFDRSNVPEMKVAAVLRLAVDGKGALWAATGDGRLLRFQGGKVEAWGEKQGLAPAMVERLFVDRDGDLWIGGQSTCRVLRGSGKIEAPGLGTWDATGPAVVRAIAQTSDGTIWAGTEGTGLRAFQDGAWKALSTPDGLVDPNVISLLADPDGSLWIGTLAGLQRLSHGRLETWGTREGLPSPRIFALGRDPDGNLWVGTDGGGLVRFLDGRFEGLAPSESGGDAFVRSLLPSDMDGSLWEGTHGGLTRLRNGLFSALRARDGLTNEVARTLFEDRRGRVWIGTDGGGLHLLEGGRVAQAPGTEPLAKARIRSIAEDPAGGIWIATLGSGLFRLEGGKLRQPSTASGPDLRNVVALLATREGDVLAGSLGLHLLRRSQWSEPAPSFGRKGVNCILETRDGALFVGTYASGLLRLKDGRETWMTEKDGLASNRVFAACEDAAGAVWIGTSLGLSRWNPATGKATSWASPEALGGQQVFSILEDDAGYLWMSNNRGVHRLSKAGLEAAADGSPGRIHLVSFGTADGMPSRQCNGANQPTAIRTRSGQLLFPTMAGVAVADPGRVIAGPKPPAVVLRRILVNGSSVPASPELSLGADLRRLQVDFAPLSLLAPDRLAFRYRLEGLDDAWRETRLRQVDFTTLPPGRYRLHVQATTDRERWSERELELGLNVAPPLLRNPVFWAVVATLLIASAFAAFQGYAARRRVLERKLQELVEQKTAALAEEKRRSDEASLRLADANRLLEGLALVDPVTGIPNRRRLDAARRTEWSRCRRLGLSLAEIVFDIDRFKAYNDAFGHPAGDECLRRVAAALVESAGRRAGDLLARAGGEEFVALLPATGIEEAMELAEAACSHVASLAIPHVVPAPGSVVTVSAGVAAVVPDRGELEQLTAAADSALYEATHLGRNRAVKADPGPQG